MKVYNPPVKSKYNELKGIAKRLQDKTSYNSEYIQSIYGEAGGVCDDLNANTIKEGQLEWARKHVYDISQKSLKERGFPEEFYVYRGGFMPKGDDSLVPVTTSKWIANRPYFVNNGGLYLYKVKRKNVLVDVDAIEHPNKGGDEKELLVMRKDLEHVSGSGRVTEGAWAEELPKGWKIKEIPRSQIKGRGGRGEKFPSNAVAGTNYHSKTIYVSADARPNVKKMLVEHEKAHLAFDRDPEAERIGEDILKSVRSAIYNRTPKNQIYETHGILPKTVSQMRHYMDNTNEAGLIEEAYAQELGLQNTRRKIIKEKEGAWAQQIVYHGRWSNTETGKDFGGKHFGTKQAVKDRLGDIYIESPTGGSRARSGLGEPVVGKYIFDDSKIFGAEEPIAEGMMTPDKGGNLRDALKTYEALPSFRQKLKDAGYTGIAYINEIEHPGSVSYLIWDTSILKETKKPKPVKLPLTGVHRRREVRKPIFVGHSPPIWNEAIKVGKVR